MMVNLLEETISILKANGKTKEDVLWIGNNEVYTDWESFEKVADVEYDDGFGVEEVARDLLIVGEDWYLSRGEYDGSEWWDFNKVIDKPKKKIELRALTTGQAKKLNPSICWFSATLQTLNYIYEE